MRVLFIEDDQKIASFVIKGLKEAGFAVDHASDGEDGLHLALTEPYDALIIDIMLPKLDGLTIIENLRVQNINTPVIILSAKRSVDDRVKGLQKGSDDYLTKPFALNNYTKIIHTSAFRLTVFLTGIFVLGLLGILWLIEIYTAFSHDEGVTQSPLLEAEGFSFC